MHNQKANTLQRGIQKLAARPLASRLLARILPTLDNAVMLITGTRFNATSLLAGLPVILLITVGAKSKLERHTFLVAISFENKLVLIASNFGGKRHPNWYFNIKANPHVKASLPGQDAQPYVARLIEGKERIMYWKAANQLYPGFQAYQKRALPRTIPIIVLTP